VNGFWSDPNVLPNKKNIQMEYCEKVSSRRTNLYINPVLIGTRKCKRGYVYNGQ